MVSRKNLLLTRLSLALLIIFNHCGQNVMAADTNKISVTDFKYFRKINYQNQQLLIYKSSEIKQLVYLTDAFEMTYRSQNSQVHSSFKASTKFAHHSLYLESGKIFYFKTSKMKYFMEKSSLCDKQSAFDLLNVGEFKAAAFKAKNEDLTDPLTCDANQKKEIGTALMNTLNEQGTWLLNKKKKKSFGTIIKDNPAYLDYTSKMYSKYLDLIKKIQEDQKPFKISCKVSDASKLGIYDESSTPPKIAINYDALKAKSTDQEPLSKKIRNTFRHELFHYGVQVDANKNITQKVCLDEAYANQFQAYCENITDTEIVLKPSAELETNCANGDQSKNIVASVNNSDNTDIITTKEIHKENGSGLAALQAQQEQDRLAAEAKLKNTVAPSNFAQPSDSDVSLLASAPTSPDSQEGKSISVSSTSTLGQMVTKTMNSFASSGNKLSTAVATINTPVIAATKATNTYQGSTTTAATAGGPTYNPSSVTTTTTRSNTNSNNVYSSGSQNTRMPASGNNGSGSEGDSTSTPNKIASSGSRASGMANPGLARTGGGEAQTSDSIGAGTSAGAGFKGATAASTSVSSNGQSKTTTTTSNQEGAALVKTVKSLEVLNSVSGEPYKDIRKYYTNSYFLNLIANKEIVIKTKNEKGQTVILGLSNRKPKKIFTDDGKVLTVKDDLKK